MSSPVELSLIGAGWRGALAYGAVALRHPDELRFVDVVEPHRGRREQFAADHRIPPERCFRGVQDWAAAPDRARGAVVATPDDQHVAPAMAALGAGYDVLVEKPLAPTAPECVALVAAARRAGRQLQVCHVLRYTPFFRALHDAVQAHIGDVVSLEQRENVAYWHMAHSYVRGAYGDTTRAAPLLLAKSCHDLDIMCWNMGGPPATVASFGSLAHFTPQHAPPGAPARCTDGCPAEATCDFSALHVYLGRPATPGDVTGPWQPETPFAFMPLGPVGSADRRSGVGTETAAERLGALRTGPYGRCVYHCGNDALDHQVVLLQWPSGVTGVLVVQGHAHDDQRTLRYDGTQGTLLGQFGDFSGRRLTRHGHRGGSVTTIPLNEVAGLHGGGDIGLMRAYARTLSGVDGPRTDADEALTSHLVGFAAEESRRTGRVVDVGDFVAAATAADAASPTVGA